MDKVKQYLIVARKHHFWILCGLAALIGLTVWTMATGKLAAEFKARQEKINQQVSLLQQITAPHPNNEWVEGIGKTTAEERENVRAAWTTLYQDEADEIFKWPAVLGKDFQAEIAKVEEGKKTELAGKLCDRYQNYVRDFAKRLPKIVDSIVADDQIGGAVAAPPKLDANGVQIVEDHRVVWDPQSQQEVYDTFSWIEAPSTTIVRQAQEELWVYESLCRVIAEVNKNSAGSHDAPITAIQQMAIAYLAQDGSAGGMSSTAHQVMRVKQGGPAGAGDGELRGGAMGPPGGGEATPGAGGAPPDPKQRCKGAMAGAGMRGPGGMAAPPADVAGGGSPDDMWKAFRYVGEDGKALATAAEVDSSLLEFNLMPFRMKLTINPKDIDRLLIAFRNTEQTVPLEVKVLRVGDVAGSGGSFVGGGGRGMPTMGGGGHGRRMDEGGPGGGGGRQPVAAIPGAPLQKTVQIEVTGVAYLFKKPDPTKLGITPSADGTMPANGTVPADGTTPAVPPAGSPPPTAMNQIKQKPVAADNPSLSDSHPRAFHLFTLSDLGYQVERASERSTRVDFPAVFRFSLACTSGWYVFPF